jgi:hypothetical protein
MSFLNEFIANFDQYGGAAYLNRFECLIISPFEANPSITTDRFVSFKVVSVTFPGKNIRTVTNENIYGPTHEMAQGLTYAESVSFTFYLSGQHVERQYFLNWMDFIYKPDTYNLEYYDNYKRNIQLYQLDRGDKRVSGLKLLDCYPKTLGAIEYAQDSGDIGTIDVEFAFKEHHMTDGNGQELTSQTIPRVSTRTGNEGRISFAASESGTFTDF